MMTQVASQQPMEDHGTTDLHPAANARASSGQADQVSCKHCSLRVIQAGAILEWLYPVERTHPEDPSDGLSPVSGAPHWSRESVKRKEQQR